MCGGCGRVRHVPTNNAKTTASFNGKPLATAPAFRTDSADACGLPLDELLPAVEPLIDVVFESSPSQLPISSSFV
jgi:hypothetical protein